MTTQSTPTTTKASTGAAAPLSLQVYPVSEQARGAFDGGKITETKPIGFPREGSAVRRIGPLFYWAWAGSTGPAVIGMHPHEGFEIVSYVLCGELGHKDTLGTNKTVGQGGIQVMQTASGVSHEEHMLGKTGTEFFQIWYEPNMNETLKKPAVYADFEADQIPTTTDPITGISHRRYLGSVQNETGKAAAFALDTDGALEAYTIPAGQSLQLYLKQGRGLGAVTIAGVADWRTAPDKPGKVAVRKEFAVAKAESGPATLYLHASGTGDLEVMIVHVPLNVDYRLYPK